MSPSAPVPPRSSSPASPAERRRGAGDDVRAPGDRTAPGLAAARARDAAVSFDGMKGIRYALRNFTALSVKEHLRSQIERGGSGAELTPNEVELVRFAADRSEQLNELADKSAATK